MSNKLKALGLSVLVTVAIGAGGVVSAGATTGGVFHSESDWTSFKGTMEGTTHQNVLVDTVLGKSFTCEEPGYAASVSGTTVTSITASATFSKCKTTDNIPATVNMGNCDFLLTVGPNPATADQTAHLTCSSGEVTLVIDPPIVGTCTIHIPPQTPTKGGLVYRPTEVGGKDSLTVDVTVEGITNTKTESGFGCLGGGGEGNNSDLLGKITTVATNTAGGAVGVTATGSGG